MTPAIAVPRILRLLEEAGLPHMVTGGLAASLHGIARSTKDADIVVELIPEGFSQFSKSLPPELVLDEQITFETITGSRRHIISIRRSPFKIELFFLGNDPHHQERFRRRLHRFLPEWGCSAWVATAEDMIVQKLRWGRGRDVEDARNILLVQGNGLDFAYIEKWCAAHGTLERLEELRRSIPPI